MLTFIVLFLIGIISSTFGAIVGLGGGIIIVPTLIYLDPVLFHLNISTSAAVGTSLLVLVITALSATLTFSKQKRIDYKSAWLLFITSGPAAMFGASLTSYLEPKQFQLYFGFLMLFMALLMISRPFLKPVNRDWKIKRTYVDLQGETFHYGYNLLPALVIGFLVGMISGLFGIGGGSLFVPIMVLLFSFPAHVATATSMFVIFLSSASGSVTHALAGDINWIAFLLLAPGAWIGGKIGALIASRLSGNKLMWLLRVTLVVLSIRMIWEGIGS